MIFFKNFISYILVRNSQMFPLLLNMFINALLKDVELFDVVLLYNQLDKLRMQMV